MTDRTEALIKEYRTASQVVDLDGHFPDNVQRLDAARAALSDHIDRMVGALHYYADPSHWRSPSTGFALQYDPVAPPAVIDCGDLARDTLKAIGELRG